MPASQHFSEFPDACFLEVLKHCRGVDVLAVQQASRRFCALGEVPAVWRTIIKRDFRLQLPKSCSYSSLKIIYRSMVESKNSIDMKTVEYWGAVTDGGIDNDALRFWVDNMFAGDISNFYCSEMHRSSHVRCIGVCPSFMYNRNRLKQIKEIVPYVHGSASKPQCKRLGSRNVRGSFENSGNSVLIDKATLSLLQSKPEDPGAIVAVNKGVRIGRMGNLTCPISCGVLLIGNYDFSSVEGGADDLASRLYMLSKSTASNTFSQFTDLDAVLAACKNNEISLPVAVSFGAGGVWVEFEVNVGTSLTGESLEAYTGSCLDLYAIGAQSAKKMQPLVWFKFYEKREDVSDTTIRDHFIAEFSSMGVKCGPVLEKVAPIPRNSDFDHYTAGIDVGDPQGLLDDWMEIAASDFSVTSEDAASVESEAIGIAGPSGLSPASHGQGDNALDHDEENIARENLPSGSLENSDQQARNSGDLQSHPIALTHLSNNDPADSESMDVFVSANSSSEESLSEGQAWVDIPNENPTGGQNQNEDENQDNAAVNPADVNNGAANDPEVPASASHQENEDGYELYNLQTPEGVQTYITLNSMARREMMDIQFHNPVVGNCVCLLINTCENLMVELEDSHEGPNVDVNFMWMLGEKLTVLE